MKIIDTDASFSATETKRDKNGAVYSKDGKKMYKGCFVETFQIPNGVEVICDRAFQPREKTERSIIRKIILPESVKAIGVCAFANNEGLEEINIPSSVQYISSNNPFGGCFSLNNVLIHSDNYIIEDDILYSSDYKLLIGAFHTKVSNRIITINSNTEIIGANSFWHLKNISQIVFPSKLKEIGMAAFKYSTILDVDLAVTKLTRISEECFQGSAVQEVFFPNFLKTIDKNAFYFSHLRKLDLSNTKVIEIGEYAFSNCNITKLILSSSLKRIGNSAFSNAFSNRFRHIVVIPSSVTNIGDLAFNDSSIIRVDIESKDISEIGEDIFDGANLETIRYKQSEIIDHPNIDYYKKEYNVEIIPLDKKKYSKVDSITLTLQSKEHVYEEISNNFYQKRIDKIFKVGSVKVDIVQLRLPIYGENYDRCLYGACVNDVFTLQPKYDAIETKIAQGKDVYFLTKTETSLGILYELYYNSKCVYAEFSNEIIGFGDDINSNFSGQKVKYGGHLYTTYYWEQIEKKFNYRASQHFFVHYLGVPLQFITITKNGKKSIFKDGKRISDYEYDDVKGIENNLESLYFDNTKVRIPQLSINYLKVEKYIDEMWLSGIIDENGKIVIPIKFKELDACRSFILADKCLYAFRNNLFKLLNENVDLSTPVVVYGEYAFFRTLGRVYCYDTKQVHLIENDYVIDEGEDYDTVFVLDEMKVEDRFHWQPREISSEEYQREMDQMYRDAFENNPEYEWNID